MMSAKPIWAFGNVSGSSPPLLLIEYLPASPQTVEQGTYYECKCSWFSDEHALSRWLGAAANSYVQSAWALIGLDPDGGWRVQRTQLDPLQQGNSPGLCALFVDYVHDLVDALTFVLPAGMTLTPEHLAQKEPS